MTIDRMLKLALTALTIGLIATPAMAQKSKDTLRIGFYDPICRKISGCIPVNNNH